jgi:predicted transposase YdaD
MRGSDSIYHRLFSHPRMVEDLIREFVPEALGSGLDFSGLQRINAKFHIKRDTAQRREADVIWRLPTREGSEIYLYLLLEFQSVSDWWMAVRTQVYQGLLWQHVIREQRLVRPQRLPPVMLLVLYNGESRWSASTKLSDLINLTPGSTLWPWQPQARYYLLDMGAFATTELAERESLAALLFRLEKSYPRIEVEGLIVEVIEWFRGHPELAELKDLFGELVRQATLRAGSKAPTPGSLEESQSMLSTLMQRWEEDWHAAGRAKGLAEGQAKGLAEGQAKGETAGTAKSLIRLLTARFGTLHPSIHRRIHATDLSNLERWLDRVIEAPDLLSVFGRHSRDRSAKANPPRAA